jgi:hypothetical protein
VKLITMFGAVMATAVSAATVAMVLTADAVHSAPMPPQLATASPAMAPPPKPALPGDYRRDPGLWCKIAREWAWLSLLGQGKDFQNILMVETREGVVYCDPSGATRLEKPTEAK